MEFFLDIAGFALKLSALVLAVFVLAILLLALFRRDRGRFSGNFSVNSINDHYRQVGEQLAGLVLNNEEKKAHKARLKSKEPEKKAFLFEFKGDVEATQVDSLREQVNAILEIAAEGDEVVVLLESAGGTLHGYGLAAAQLLRLREAGLRLTICVDQMAASGGYLMACVAHHLIAAPFAYLGAIGVVVSLPNFHRLLEKLDVDYLELTAGPYKRTLSYLGEVTESGRDKCLEDLQLSHQLLKEFIQRFRPGLEIEKVATGEEWHGTRAMELGLLDALGTSDEYLINLTKTARVFRVDYEGPKTMRDRFSGILSESADKLILRWANRMSRKAQVLGR